MEDAETNEGQRNIRVRPGYTEQIRDNQAYIRPSVLDPTPDLSLFATTKKADLRQAVEMPGGVSLLFNCFLVPSTRIYWCGVGPESDFGFGFGFGFFFFLNCIH
jgi:hypothetical protein